MRLKRPAVMAATVLGCVIAMAIRDAELELIADHGALLPVLRRRFGS